MLSSNSAAATSTWEVTGAALIEYSRSVLEEVRRLAVDGFNAFGHGGLEIGGVLYGVSDGTRVSVLASAELACEHALGPGFVLSENDRRGLMSLLEPPPGLQTIGWYRAHTRTGVELDARDRDLFQLFGSRQCIGLVLKPTRWGVAAAAFYVRQPSGEILPPEAREFTLDPLRQETDLPSEGASAPEREPEPGPETFDQPPASPQPEAALVVLPRPVSIYSAPRDGVQRLPRALPAHRVRWALVGGATIGILAAVIYLSRPQRNLALQVYATAPGQVRIEWNHRSRPVLDGASAVLNIRDGDSTVTIPMDANQLASSSISYQQYSAHITVRMHVDRRQRGAAPVEESVEFVGLPAPRAPVAAATVPPTRAEIQGPLKEAGPPRQPEPAVSAPADTEKKKPEPQLITVPVQLPRPSAPPPQKRFTMPPPRQNAAAQGSTLPTAPLAQTTQPVQTGLPEFLSRPQTAPRTQPPANTGQPAYSGPRAGRLIWTGSLDRRGVVEIDGSHASIGSLSGSLPGVPVATRVWPAEFTHDGLIVYTPDSSVQGRSEPASKSNGWNPLHFQFDPPRARELVLLETPNAANEFNRLVVRNDARTCAVIIVDWSVR